MMGTYDSEAKTNVGASLGSGNAATNQIKPLTLGQCIERAERLSCLAGELSSLAEAIASMFGAGSPPAVSGAIRDEVVRDMPGHIPDAMMHHLRNFESRIDETMTSLRRLADRIPM